MDICMTPFSAVFSALTTMTDAGYSQNFNRYSCCQNNLLTYTDLSAELACFVPVIAGSIIGAYASASIQIKVCRIFKGTLMPANYKYERIAVTYKQSGKYLFPCSLEVFLSGTPP